MCKYCAKLHPKAITELRLLFEFYVFVLVGVQSSC